MSVGKVNYRINTQGQLNALEKLLGIKLEGVKPGHASISKKIEKICAIGGECEYHTIFKIATDKERQTDEYYDFFTYDEIAVDVNSGIVYEYPQCEPVKKGGGVPCDSVPPTILSENKKAALKLAQAFRKCPQKKGITPWDINNVRKRFGLPVCE